MAPKTSITEVDLNPIPGKRYMSFTREWREEFIYFLLVDRFHDDRSRTPVRQSHWRRDDRPIPGELRETDAMS